MNATPQSRADFIHEHLLVCQASAAKKYDNAKDAKGLHTLEYSRRKCAKSLWRRKLRDHRLTT